MNSVQLTGRLTSDPVLKQTNSGKEVTSFKLAVNRRTSNGEQSADFVPCVAWNQTAKVICQYMKKGALIGLNGRIQTRDYEDNSGKKIYITEVLVSEVEFLETKKKQEPQQQEERYELPEGAIDISSDDLPF